MVYLGKGNRGRHPKIVVDDFVYNMHSQNERQQTRWRCTHVNMTKCRAVLYTQGHVINMVRDHNHRPPAESHFYKDWIQKSFQVVKDF